MISVVIVSFRSTSVLSQCLRELVSELGEGDEVIVIENSQDSRVAKFPFFTRPNFALIVNKENVGYSKACNQGIQMAVNEQILLLNPDTIPKRGAFDDLRTLLRTNERNSLYAVELINPDGSRQDYYRRFPGVWSLLIMFFVPSTMQTRFRAYRDYTYASDYLSRNSFEQPPGAGLIIPKTIRLDEDFFVYGSDLMVCWDFVRKNNQEVVLLPVQFIHFRGQGGTSSSPDLADWLRCESAIGFALFFAKSGQLTRRMLWVITYVAIEGAGILYYLFDTVERIRRIRRLQAFLYGL